MPKGAAKKALPESTTPAKVVFSAQPMVQITIAGEETSRRGYEGRRDGGAILKFVQFILAEQLKGFPGSVMGAGIYRGYFELSELPKIDQWMKENGISSQETPQLHPAEAPDVANTEEPPEPLAPLDPAVIMP